MNKPYETGCNQHCNDGSDCTEKVVVCVIPEAEENHEDPPIGAVGCLLLAFICFCSAASVIISVFLIFKYLVKT